MRYGPKALHGALATMMAGWLACSDGSARREGEPAAEPAPATPETTVANTTEVSPANVTTGHEPAVASAEGTGAPAQPVAPETNVPAAAPPEPPPDIFAVMATSGYALEGTDDLADYLPVPPRSEGQVGRFTRDGERITVSRVTYPEAVFADPHEAWIRERITVVPEANERVVRSGATVIHIRASSAAAADAVLDVFGDELRPAGPGDDG